MAQENGAETGYSPIDSISVLSLRVFHGKIPIDFESSDIRALVENSLEGKFVCPVGSEDFMKRYDETRPITTP